MFEKCFEEGRSNPKLEPSTIFVACSKPPDDKDSVFAVMEGKGVPIQALAFDEEMENDEECKAFFADLCGPKGTYLYNTNRCINWGWHHSDLSAFLVFSSDREDEARPEENILQHRNITFFTTHRWHASGHEL